MLARGVDGQAATLLKASDAANQNQIAARPVGTLVLAQVVHANPGREQRPFQVDIDLRGWRFNCDVRLRQERVLGDGHARIGDDDVDTAELLFRRVEQTQLIGIRRSVAVHVADICPSKPRFEVLCGFVLHVAEDDLCAGGCMYVT